MAAPVSTSPRTPSPPRVDDEPTRGFLVTAYLVLALSGVVLGLFGVFLLSAGPRVGGTLVLPVGLAIAVVGHPLAALAGLRLTDTRAGTLTPLAGWSLAVLPLSAGTAEGDVVLPGTALSVGYLLTGVAAFAAVALLTRPRRGLAGSAGAPVA